MANPTNRHPTRMILPTHQLVREIRERLSQLNLVEYDLAQIGSETLAALSYLDRLTESRNRLIGSYVQRYTAADDQQLIASVIGNFFDSMNWLVDRLGIRDERGMCNYLFDRWHRDDMVVSHFPY